MSINSPATLIRSLGTISAHYLLMDFLYTISLKVHGLKAELLCPRPFPLPYLGTINGP